MTSPSDLPVIIIGAGISGLALGQSLSRRQIPFRIFERDSSFTQRSQGYRVRISGDGIQALRSCLTPDLCKQLEDSCAEVTTQGNGPLWQLDALTGELSHNQRKLGPQPGARSPMVVPVDVQPLSADRSVLRNVLMHGLRSNVEVSKEFDSYEILPNGVRVTFHDGSVTEGRLLVGADGASSRVRKQLAPAYQQIDTGGRFIYGKTLLTKEIEQSFQPKCLEGLSLVQDTTTSETTLTLLLEPIRFKENDCRNQLPENYIYWVLLAREDRHHVSGHDLLHLSNSDVAAHARCLTTHWHPSFHALFNYQDTAQSSLIRIISAQIELPRWDSEGKVTLMGDAVHVMSPTAGVGATTALRDAARLAEGLADESHQDQSVARYEEAMKKWGSEAILRSQIAGKILFDMRPFAELGFVDV